MAHTPSGEPTAFEAWWATQDIGADKDAKLAIKFAAWNGWLARATQSESGEPTVPRKLAEEWRDTHSRELNEVRARAFPVDMPKGVSRMADNDKAVLVTFKRRPTDDELRALHDALAGRGQ